MRCAGPLGGAGAIRRPRSGEVGGGGWGANCQDLCATRTMHAPEQAHLPSFLINRIRAMLWQVCRQHALQRVQQEGMRRDPRALGTAVPHAV